PMVVFTYADWMLNRPRSSLPTTRRIRASRLSAGSSGGMSRVPIAAWNVRLSRLRTRTVLRIELIRFVGSAVGGRGRGILPRGPRTPPSRSPITGISGASAMKKSYAAARARAFRLSLAYSSISCGWMTRSATARAFRASSPEANTQTRIGLPRPFGRTTSSSTRFFGTDRSTSRRFTATSTDSLNSRGFAASRSFLIVSTECLSAKGNRLLQFARPTEPPARGRRRKSVALIRLCGPRALHGSCGRSAADEALPPHRGSFAVRARDQLNYQRPADNARNAFVAGFPSRPDAGGGHRAGARDARPHRERRAGLSGLGAERRVNGSRGESAPRRPVSRGVSHPPIAPSEGLDRSVPRAAESIPSSSAPNRGGRGPAD